MHTFNTLYIKLIIEMARPNMIIPSLIGQKDYDRYLELIGKINKCMKYGTDLNGNELIDNDNEVADGLGDEILQDRRYRYFIFKLNRYGRNLNPNSPTYRIDFQKEIVKSHNLAKEILIQHDSWTKTSTTTKLTTAIGLMIRIHRHYFNSSEFENDLLDPTNIATFMNYSRTKNEHTSQTAAKQREEVYGMNIKDIHGIRAKTRDDITKMNRRAHHDSLRKHKPSTNQ